MSRAMDRECVVKTYDRWAPVYDLVFGQVFEKARKSAIAACEAIIRGASLGEVRALSTAIQKVSALKPPERAPARARIEAVAELALRVAHELQT